MYFMRNIVFFVYLLLSHKITKVTVQLDFLLISVYIFMHKLLLILLQFVFTVHKTTLVE